MIEITDTEKILENLKLEFKHLFPWNFDSTRNHLYLSTI